ncbi:glycosyltransferase family 4 protein [Aeromonas caviae]|uniref:glycosyltransferase family 4 protein n=1 Tax=Aeromonas caviae TaxID=648 RepID=UPI001CC3FDAF|nr:glycosyltransferase family 4 protein [Aeromonas caviae]
MIPMAMTKITGQRSNIFYWCRKNSVDVEIFRDLVELRPIMARGRLHFIFKVLMVIIRERFTVVNVYHLKNETLIISFLLNLLSIGVYLKLDMDTTGIDHLRKKLNSVIYRAVLSYIVKKIHFISVESRSILNELKKLNTGFAHTKLITNAILTETVLAPRADFCYRENIILISGRIGVHQKNHELILSSLELIDDLQDWNIVFAGPVEDDFWGRVEKSKISAMVKNRIKFVGELNRKEIFELYSKTKVFLLPSRREGFSLALLEAAYMGCYIVATDVGGVGEVTKDGDFGSIFPQEDTYELSNIIRTIINGELDIATSYDRRVSYIEATFDIERNLRRINWNKINGRSI